MKISQELELLLQKSAVYAGQERHEYVTPEHVMLTLTYDKKFSHCYVNCGGNIKELRKELEEYLRKNVGGLPETKTEIPVSYGLHEALIEAAMQAESAGQQMVELVHLIYGFFRLKECFGTYVMHTQGVEEVDMLTELHSRNWEEEPKPEEAPALEENSSAYMTCMNEEAVSMNPLIGREEELERTIQVLLRKDKNNPLHIGEPGVGKTAIAYGLAARINAGNVPDELKGVRMYALDLGAMLAGTQLRGDFEKRLKEAMKQLERENRPILYIDEIHTIVGAGATTGSSMDASNLLKPYLTRGTIRFIGATTFEEYKKYFAKNKSMVRRFQNIEIKEPTTKEAVDILEGLKPYYEKWHHVTYQKGSIEHAVQLSTRYLNERYLPDKAIDLIDEAGAYRVMHPENRKRQTVDKKLIEEVLSKTCQIPKQTIETEEIKKLSRLEKDLKEHVFGQMEAVEELASAVKFSKAGLREAEKPVASLLFVGPTGVGKTELARSLAQVLGIELIRFDMSEYAEKHTVAKLIGSPAGYVGYEEGGLLTETIRKKPHSVLLLDEIEKAHPDIFNVLLQVMDYATLTDNQGQKADFRNVILIMTSNAGAREAGKMTMGFGGETQNEGAIDTEVKRVFSPEFRNRLDRIIIFHPIDKKMAMQITDKKITALKEQLTTKHVDIQLSKKAREYFASKGMSKEYGAREIQRIIDAELKSLLVDEILFGKLKKGGNCTVGCEDGKIELAIEQV